MASLMVIAFEDVGIGSLEAIIKTTTACTDPNERASIGGDERAVLLFSPAFSPKRRGPIARPSDGSGLEPSCIRGRARHGRRTPTRQASQSGRRHELAAAGASIAAWYSSGIEWP